MSLILDDAELGKKLAEDNEQIIQLLKSVVLLLEIIADADVGSTIKTVNGD